MIENEYINIKMVGLKKPQLDKIVLNKRFVDTINREEIKNYLNFRAFIKIPSWLAQSNELKSNQIYGRITKITPKAIQLNYSYFFIPISQIQEIHIRRNTLKHEQTLLTQYEEIAPT